MKNNKKMRGFTLIELLIVMAVLAILSLLAVQKYFSLSMQAQLKTDLYNCRVYLSGVHYYNEKMSTPYDGSGDLIVALQTCGYLPATAENAPALDSNGEYFYDTTDEVVKINVSIPIEFYNSLSASEKTQIIRIP